MAPDCEGPAPGGLSTRELLKFHARLETETRVEPAARLLVNLERFRLPPGAIERKHELRHEALAVRVRARDECL